MTRAWNRRIHSNTPLQGRAQSFLFDFSSLPSAREISNYFDVRCIFDSIIADVVMCWYNPGIRASSRPLCAWWRVFRSAIETFARHSKCVCQIKLSASACRHRLCILRSAFAVYIAQPSRHLSLGSTSPALSPSDSVRSVSLSSSMCDAVRSMARCILYDYRARPPTMQPFVITSMSDVNVLWSIRLSNACGLSSVPASAAAATTLEWWSFRCRPIPGRRRRPIWRDAWSLLVSACRGTVNRRTCTPASAAVAAMATNCSGRLPLEHLASSVRLTSPAAWQSACSAVRSFVRFFSVHVLVTVSLLFVVANRTWNASAAMLLIVVVVRPMFDSTVVRECGCWCVCSWRHICSRFYHTTILRRIKRIRADN